MRFGRRRQPQEQDEPEGREMARAAFRAGGEIDERHGDWSDLPVILHTREEG